MPTVIRALLDTAINALFGGGGQNLSTVVQAIQQMLGLYADMFEDDLDVHYQEHGAVLWSADDAKQIGHDFEQIEGDWESNFTRLTDVILPASLKHAYNVVYTNLIQPLQQRMDAAESGIKNHNARITILEVWRANRADPLLTGYQQFVNWWNANFQGAALTLIDWLNTPAHFGEWAAAPLIGPTINYYADATHADSRDNLAKIMVAAWYEEPEAIWTLIQQWLLAEG